METHKITTKDGFVLVAYRVTQGRNSSFPPPNPPRRQSAVKRPIILGHALVSSSSDWLMNTPDKALGFILADSGLDVWFINNRGTTYSNKHNYHRQNQSEYWDWSFHEMGTIDLPLWIDYVLNVTRYPDLYYAGFSMGCTYFFVMMSEKPEYNEKVRKMFALGPSVYLSEYPQYWMFCKMVNVYGQIYDAKGHTRFMPETVRKWLNFMGYTCYEVQPLCDNYLYLMVGHSPEQRNSTQTAVIVSHTPDDVSSKAVIHFFQIMKAKRFQMYDYGKLQNNVRYKGLTVPPAYNITRVSTPVTMFYTKNDVYATKKDMKRCANELGNLEELILIKNEKFTHIDLVYGIDADVLVYQKMLDKIIDEEGEKNVE